MPRRIGGSMLIGITGSAARPRTVQQQQSVGIDAWESNQMEPHATLAVWDTEGTLTLYETTQHIFGTTQGG
jgi:CO/xanthine dehydrogenase Mo-binding subunit